MVIPATANRSLAIETAYKKKNLKKIFIGSPLKNVSISSFANYGIPVPLYTDNRELLLLFKNYTERDSYVANLHLIRSDMQDYDPNRQNMKIQQAIAFIDQVLESIL